MSLFHWFFLIFLNASISAGPLEDLSTMPDLSLFYQQLTRQQDLQMLLQGIFPQQQFPGPNDFTIFAPTNEAMQRITLRLADPNLLLKYHIVPGRYDDQTLFNMAQEKFNQFNGRQFFNGRVQNNLPSVAVPFQLFYGLGFYGDSGPNANETTENAGYGSGGISWLTNTYFNRSTSADTYLPVNPFMQNRHGQRSKRNYFGNNQGQFNEFNPNVQQLPTGQQPSGNSNFMTQNFSQNSQIDPRFVQKQFFQPGPTYFDGTPGDSGVGRLRPTINNAFILQSRPMSRGIINVIDHILWPPERQDQNRIKLAFDTLEEPQFSRLRQLAERSEYFRSELRSNNHQTWFFPTDQAFASMGSTFSYLIDQSSMNNTNEMNDFIRAHILPMVIYPNSMDSTKRIPSLSNNRWITFRKVSQPDYSFQVDVVSGRLAGRILVSRPEDIQIAANGVVYPISSVLSTPVRSAAEELTRGYQYFMNLVQQSGDLELINILQGTSNPNVFNLQPMYNITILVPQQSSIQQLGNSQELSMNLRRHIIRFPVYLEDIRQTPVASQSYLQQNFYQGGQQMQPIIPFQQQQPGFGKQQQQQSGLNNQPQPPLTGQQQQPTFNAQQQQQQQPAYTGQQQQQTGFYNLQQRQQQSGLNNQQQQQPGFNDQQQQSSFNNLQQQQPSLTSQQQSNVNNQKQQLPSFIGQQQQPNFNGQQMQQGFNNQQQQMNFIQTGFNNQRQQSQYQIPQFQGAATSSYTQAPRLRRQANPSFQNQQFPGQQYSNQQQLPTQQFPNQPQPPIQQFPNQQQLPTQQFPNQPQLPTQQFPNQQQLPTQQQYPNPQQSIPNQYPGQPIPDPNAFGTGNYPQQIFFQNGQVYPTMDPQFSIQAQTNIGQNGIVITLIGRSPNSAPFTATIINSESNVPVRNGVVHVIRGLLAGAVIGIDSVLPTIQGTSTFGQLLQQSGVLDQLKQSGRPHTLFVPTNAALQAVGAMNSPGQLRQFILRHICADVLLDPVSNIIRRSAGIYSQERPGQRMPGIFRQKRQDWGNIRRNETMFINQQGMRNPSNFGQPFFQQQQQQPYGSGYSSGSIQYGSNNQLYNPTNTMNNYGPGNVGFGSAFNGSMMQRQPFSNMIPQDSWNETMKNPSFQRQGTFETNLPPGNNQFQNNPSNAIYMSGPQSCLSMSGERVSVQSLRGTQSEGNAPSLIYQNYIVTCCGDHSINSMIQSYNVYPPTAAVYVIGRPLLSNGQTVSSLYNRQSKQSPCNLLVIVLLISMFFNEVKNN